VAEFYMSGETTHFQSLYNLDLYFFIYFIYTMANGGMATSYTISIIIGLLVAYAINYFVPTLNPFIKFFIIPLVVIYVMLMLFRIIFPGINRWGKKIADYSNNNASSNIYAMSYVEIFPPIFIVFVLIIVLLYSGLFK
jgi:hypothetical protein